MHIVYDGHERRGGRLCPGKGVSIVVGEVLMSIVCWAFKEEVMDGFSWCIACWAAWRICYVNGGLEGCDGTQLE